MPRDFAEIHLTGGAILIGTRTSPDVALWQKALGQNRLAPLARARLQQGEHAAAAQLRRLVDRLDLGLCVRFTMTDGAVVRSVLRAIDHGRAAAVFLPDTLMRRSASPTTPPAPVPRRPRAELPSAMLNPAGMTPLQRMETMLRRTPLYLQGSVHDAFEAMVSPEALAVTAAALLALVVAQAYGVGEIADAAIAGWAYYTASFAGLRALYAAVVALKAASEATRVEAIDAAAHQFADAVTILGVALLTMSLTRVARRGSRTDPIEDVRAGVKRVPRRSVDSAGPGDSVPIEYNMIENPGPLAKLRGNPAAAFAGGRYRAQTLTEDTVYYRGGDSSSPLGQWFTTEKPTSVAGVRIDSAVKPQWIDPVTGEFTGKSPIDTVYGILIPKGTTVYVGPAGSQGGVYVGGTSQTFIEEPWKIPGVRVVSKASLK